MKHIIKEDKLETAKKPKIRGGKVRPIITKLDKE